MTTTLKAARKALAAQITAAGLSNVTVYDHEPPAPIAGVSVTVSSAGIAETEWSLAVTVYVTATVPETAQDALDDTCEAVDALLEPAPRSKWEFGFHEVFEAFAGTTTVDYPRDDF